MLRVPIAVPSARVERALAGLGEAESGDVRAMLEWVAGYTGDDDELELAQHGIQRFLWYALPRKWTPALDEQIALTEMLARFLVALDPDGRGPVYAEICRSEATHALLALYQRDEEAAIEEFGRLEEATGIEPPDTPALSWGGVMGIEEATLREQAASALEAAIELGDIEPGKRGWRSAQAQVLERFLSLPREELDGRTPLEQIHRERIESWRDSYRERHSEMANRVWPLIAAGAEPIRSAQATEVAAPLRWLLETARERDGLKLTKGGALSRALVREAVDRYPSWWESEIFGPPHREADVHPLEELHDLARLGKLLRKSRERLVLAPAGRACLDDSATLIDAAARGLLGEGFDAAVAEVVLATLLLRDEVDSATLAADAHPIVVEAGWSHGGGGAIAAATMMYEIPRTLWRGVALGAIDHPLLGASTLTPGGRLLAARTLWLHATAPRGWV